MPSPHFPGKVGGPEELSIFVVFRPVSCPCSFAGRGRRWCCTGVGRRTKPGNRPQASLTFPTRKTVPHPARLPQIPFKPLDWKNGTWASSSSTTTPTPWIHWPSGQWSQNCTRSLALKKAAPASLLPGPGAPSCHSGVSPSSLRLYNVS